MSSSPPPSPRPSQNVRVIVLGLVGAVAAFFLFGGARGGGAAAEPLDAIPRESFLVATLNLAELRQSPLYAVLLGDGRGGKTEGALLNPRAIGIGKLADACGFDPLGRVERLALALPEEGDRGEFGVAARVTVTRDELSRCSENLAGQRGGKVDTKEVGSFAVIEDAEAAQEAARPRLAYGHGGLLVAGRGTWFDAMLSAADGKRAGAREAPGHAAIRSSLTRPDGWQFPTVLVSALLPRTLRERLKGEMGAEASAAGGKDVMAGVLGVSSVGLAVKAGTQSIDAALELFCDTEDACAAVEKLILKKRLDWSKELMLRMVGLGPLLDSTEVKRDGLKIRVTAGAPATALATTLDRVLRFSAGAARGLPGDDGPRSPVEKSSAPKKPEGQRGSETIPAPRPSQ